MWNRISLTVMVGLFTLVAPLGAQTPSDVKKPYRVRIVVDIAQHRLLTEIFRQQVMRELHDGLQAALGDLGRVDVTDKHSLLEDIRTRGLDRALDGYRERSDFVTHFIRIDFSGTIYRIETRLFNGLTGLPGPSVRQDRTRDRAYVSRVATLLLQQDLGLIGTVITEPDGQKLVQVELKGGRLGVDLGRWVKKNEVFALARVDAAGPGQRVPWAVLQVTAPPVDGICTCRLYSRFAIRRLTGLRAILLGTRTATLKLRLMQDREDGRTIRLETPVTLQIRKRGFEGEESSMLQFVPTPPGKDIDTARFGAKGQFSRLAFVTVLTGSQARATVAIPIVDDNLVVLKVPIKTDEDDAVPQSFQFLRSKVIDAFLVQADRFREINELTAKPEDRSKALARVKETIKRSQKDHQELSKERDAVEREIAKLTAEKRKGFNLQGIDDLLKKLKDGEAELEKHVALLEKIEKEENDPKRKEWLVQEQRAKLLEKDGDLDKAIAIYEKAPEDFQTPELKKHIEDLKVQWKTVDEEHKKARAFIYESFPKFSTSALKDKIDEARKAFETCKKHNDLIGPTRLIREITTHVKRIEKELDELKPDVNSDDEKPAQAIKELLPRIRDLFREVETYLKSK